MKDERKKWSGPDRPPVFVTGKPRSTTSSTTEFYSNSRTQPTIQRSNSSAFSLNDTRDNYGQLTFLTSKYGTRHVNRLNRDMYRGYSNRYSDNQPDFQYGYGAGYDTRRPESRDKFNYPKPNIVRFQDDYAPSLNYERNTWDLNEDY